MNRTQVNEGLVSSTANSGNLLLIELVSARDSILWQLIFGCRSPAVAPSPSNVLNEHFSNSLSKSLNDAPDKINHNLGGKIHSCPERAQLLQAALESILMEPTDITLGTDCVEMVVTDCTPVHPS